MAMVINALREKVRRKELYIAAAIGVLILVAFCSDALSKGFEMNIVLSVIKKINQNKE